jgi:large subunit ribosomal protein L15
MLTLTNLKSPKGANRDTKRIGRGQASGQGTQAGKGHKGQKARKSGHVRTGFEGNNLPLYMRLPKRGFKNEPFKIKFATVSLSKINDKFESGEVSRITLIEKGLISGADKRNPIKILANGEISKSLTFVDIDKFTKKSLELITKAGGKIQNTKEN